MKEFFAQELPFNGENKLFLCTRNIRVGDTVIWLDGAYRTWAMHQGVFINDEINRKIFLEDHGKRKWAITLGEVSPNAKWVTNGMQFDKEQIKRATYWYNGKSKRYSTVDHSDCTDEEWADLTNREFPDENGFQICYMVEGPCTHFH